MLIIGYLGIFLILPPYLFVFFMAIVFIVLFVVVVAVDVTVAVGFA